MDAPAWGKTPDAKSVIVRIVVIALGGYAGSRVVRVWGSATEYDSAPAMSPAIPSVHM